MKTNKFFFLDVTLLNYNDHQPTNKYLDPLALKSFIPHILQPTRITTHSKTLIDNVFLNIVAHNIW